MTPFVFHRPASVASAVQLRSTQADASYLAGGQSLLPAMKLGLAGPSDLIDLSLLPGTQGIAADGGSLRIGAMTPHAVVAASAEVLKHIPALACLAAGIGDPAVRSRGTVGGSLAQNDPAACWPAAALGLGATVHTDRRSICRRRLLPRPVRDRAATGRADHGGELPGAQARGLCQVQAAGLALCAGGRVRQRGAAGRARGRHRRRALRVPRPRRWKRRWPSRSRRRRSMASSCRRTALNTDLHASAAYRAHLVGVLARRAVAQAV